MVYSHDLYGNRHLVLDITGQKFGRLLAIKEAYFKRGMYWLFLCDCGMGRAVISASVIDGNTRSCGCSRRKKAKYPFIVEIRSALWHRWETEELAKKYRSMMNRCYNPAATSYDNYGGRGIAIYKEWLQDFDAFVLWALENDYDYGLTIDRIDNYKGYSPTNCRWVTMEENLQNKRVHQDARGGLPV